MPPEIQCERHGTCGVITLDRPEVLNALTHDMVKAIAMALEAWAVDPAVSRVIIEAKGEKAFCAGGDIRMIYTAAQSGDYSVPLSFWRDEYRLNQRIKRYTKPFVALVDGLVMGGGVGISLHGSHVIAGDRFRFAMPEVGIGFFPDVGATWFLSHLPQHWGRWLALTGTSIGADNALALGLCHAVVSSGHLTGLRDALVQGDDVDAAIQRHARAGSRPVLPPANAMMACFAADTVPEIINSLQGLAGAGDAEAQATLALLDAKSPTSLCIALRQMQVGSQMDFEQALQAEFRIVSRIVRSPEFHEGVRAAVIDKDRRPRWNPARVEDVEQQTIDAMFAPLKSDELTFAEAGTIR